MGETKETVRAVLSRHYLLRHAPVPELDRLADLATTRRFAAGDTVFVKGDPGTSMMAVLEGRIRISSISEEGREVMLAVFGPGDVFGEIAMIDGGERTADAVALEPTLLLVLTRREFMPFLERNPKVCIKLLEMLCKRFRQTDEQIEDFNFLHLRSRLAKRLVFLAEQYGAKAHDGTQITIPLPQHLLASMMGTSREAVNKQLRGFEEAKLIDVRRGNVTVLDRHGLERIVSDHE